MKIIFENRFTLLPKSDKDNAEIAKLKTHIPHRHDYKNT